MLHFSGRIPVSIYPTFWIFAALIGYMNSASLWGTLIWIGIIFVSVLFHEYGHALTAVFFGQKPRIELVALGGLTYHDGQKLPFWKQFFIVLDGPLFGFLLFVIATLLLQVPALAQGMSGTILNLTRAVNLFWTVVNLLPVLPLDGGQLLRIIMEAIFGARGFRYALIASVGVAVLISLFFFLYQAFIVGALFFLLAFQSFDTFRRTRHFSPKDRDESLRDLLNEAEKAMQAGRKAEALALAEKVRAQTKEGMLYTLATQYTALLKDTMGKSEEAYQLLLPLKEELAPDALCLLHKLAFEQQNFALVIALGGDCFQTWPTAEIALRNAYAHGALAQAVPAVGWLQTALEEGGITFDAMIGDHRLDPIRNDAAFQQFATLKRE